MRRLLRLLLPLCVTPMLASCVFLLDYNDLQSGGAVEPGGAGGVPAVSESGAATGGAEGGNSSSSCGDCNDHDACTVDTCDETGATPTCLHEPTEGLKLDGFETALTADRFVRVSLVASGQLFYLAALRVDKDVPRVSLHRLASDGLELEPIGTDLKLEGTPVSNVGLAVEELALGDVALHGFLAVKPRVGNLAPRVFHLVNHADVTTSNVVLGADYKADNETVFPQALSIGGKVVGAWIQPDGTIAVRDVGGARTDTFGAVTLPAATLSLLSTGDNKPAVMFTAQNATAAIGAYVETSGQNRTRLEECETRPGQYLSSSVIGTQVPGLWLATITRFGNDYLTSGSGTLLCGNNACSAVVEDCAAAKPSNGIRNIAGAAVHFATDDPGILYSVVAIPQIAPRADDPATPEAKLSLALSRADVSAPAKTDSTTIGGDVDTGLLEIAHNDTTEADGFVGPDWPAVGILPSQQVAVAWIQPAAATAGSELHVQRYKMCLPAP